MNIEFFKVLCDENQELVDMMKKCEHAYKGKPNPYHLENSVWEHTKLVFEQLPENCDNDLIVAAMFHDAGKCLTRKEHHEKEKTSFFGHEFASHIFLVDWLVKYNRKLNNLNSVFLAINSHLRYHSQTNPEKIAQWCNYKQVNYDYLFHLGNADSNGRKTKVPYSNKIYRWDSYLNDVHARNSKVQLCDVVLFGGVPGCGKDYIASTDKFGKFDVIFSWDDIRIEQYKLENPKGWKNYSESDLYGNALNWCNKKKIDLNKHLKEKIDGALKKEERIAICNTFCNMKNRASVLHLIPQKYETGAVHVFCDLKTMIDRDKKRLSHTVGEAVIKRFAYEQVLPTCEEGFKNCDYIINNPNYKGE